MVTKIEQKEHDMVLLMNVHWWTNLFHLKIEGCFVSCILYLVKLLCSAIFMSDGIFLCNWRNPSLHLSYRKKSTLLYYCKVWAALFYLKSNCISLSKKHVTSSCSLAQDYLVWQCTGYRRCDSNCLNLSCSKAIHSSLYSDVFDVPKPSMLTRSAVSE